jgi:hypothetical protein
MLVINLGFLFHEQSNYIFLQRQKLFIKKYNSPLLKSFEVFHFISMINKCMAEVKSGALMSTISWKPTHIICKSPNQVLLANKQKIKSQHIGLAGIATAN